MKTHVLAADGLRSGVEARIAVGDEHVRAGVQDRHEPCGGGEVIYVYVYGELCGSWTLIRTGEGEDSPTWKADSHRDRGLVQGSVHRQKQVSEYQKTVPEDGEPHLQYRIFRLWKL